MALTVWPGIAVTANVGFHTVVPLIALLGLVHFRVALATRILSRTGRCDQGGFYHHASKQHQATMAQQALDGLEDLLGQLVLFQQMTEPQNGAFGGLACIGFELSKLTKQQHIEQCFFHSLVGQAKLLLQEVQAQHVGRCERWRLYGAIGLIKAAQRTVRSISPSNSRLRGVLATHVHLDFFPELKVPVPHVAR